MMLYKPEVGGKCYGFEVGDQEQADGMRMLKLAKQKEGRLLLPIPMHFDGAKQRMSVMAGPDGRALMRKFSDLAKARQAQRAAKRGDPVPGQVKLTEIQDDGTMPF